VLKKVKAKEVRKAKKDLNFSPAPLLSIAMLLWPFPARRIFAILIRFLRKKYPNTQ